MAAGVHDSDVAGGPSQQKKKGRKIILGEPAHATPGKPHPIGEFQTAVYLVVFNAHACRIMPSYGRVLKFLENSVTKKRVHRLITPPTLLTVIHHVETLLLRRFPLLLKLTTNNNLPQNIFYALNGKRHQFSRR